METALEQFMDNMEQDNQELVALVAKSQEEAREDQQLKELRIAELELKCTQLEEALQRCQQAADRKAIQAATAIDLPASQADLDATASQIQSQSPSHADQPDLAERAIKSRYKLLFDLYEEGKSIEAIAKKLSLNKGEVQLILGLAKQEEAYRA